MTLTGCFLTSSLIPEGILQDGQTYYWHAYTRGATVTNPTWTNSFTVDLRTGRDSTQVYQDVGPMGISLATGNGTTSTGSHSIAALGGPIGISMTYNTPAASRPGLLGEYWNNMSYSGAPNLSRVDQQIDFDWGPGSPSTGVINNNGVSMRWSGHMTVPTTGTYYFGCEGDEWCKISINSSTYYLNAQGWSSTPITLNAGQTYALVFEHQDGSGNAKTKFKVKGAVAEQVVPTAWLSTGPRDVTTKYGLVGRYYNDEDVTGTFPTDPNDVDRLMMVRTDPKLTFNWALGSPTPGLPSNNWLVRWKGYITVPTTGTYTLGANADDKVRIKLDGQAPYGADLTVLDSWSYTSAVRWGSDVSLTAGVQVPVTIEFAEATGDASFQLMMRGTNMAAQEMPVTWLTPQVNVLPLGWELGVGDGGVRYERLQINSATAVLSDSTGETYTYKWQNNGYTPPSNTEASLTKNADNTHTVLDTDGKTYIFDVAGKLISVTSPEDDKKPAALKYEYADNPSRLIKIIDGVDSSRSGTLHYSGDNQCTVSSGFSSAPSGMLCAFKTTDGQITKFQYLNGNLSRVELPGGANLDYGYDSLGRITTMRDAIANDAIAAGVRANDAKATVSITYDNIGRVSKITSPSPTAAGQRIENTVKYFQGSTELNVTGATEPQGFSRRVVYDNMMRSTSVTDLTGKTSTTEWHAEKDMIFSVTDPTGMKSTTIYNDNDLPIDSYGPAPSAWFGADRKPIAGKVNEVPRSSTAYDEGLTGLGVSYYDNKKLLREPKLNSTVTWPTNTNVVSTFASGAPPVTATDGWGARYSGKVKLNTAGNYTFKVQGDAGFRLFVDDQLIVNGWGDGNRTGASNVASGIFNNATAGSSKRIRIEHHHQPSTATSLQLFITPPGGSETSVVSNLLSPDYGLVTSSIVYDAQLGNLTTQTNYSKPEYGLASSTVLDPGGLNLQTSATYETATNTYHRQLSSTLPGGAQTTYEYYGDTEARDNPCTPATESYKQAGFTKIKNDPDPDGGGSQVGRKTETVYDDTGKVVAVRYNSEDWACTTYDARGRATVTVVPAFGSKPVRTITNNYAVDNNPLKISSSDDSGTITIQSDLLGNTVSYTDAKGKTTTSTYDNFGKLTQRSGVLGTEEFAYDSYDRPTTYKLDGTTYSTVTYDQYSRVATITYPAGISLSSISRDSLERENGTTYTLPGSVTVTDSVTFSQSGNIVSGTENGVTKSYTYDSVDRLTGATIGANTFAYEFGAPDSSCASLSGNNAIAAKSSNRTKLTFNGVVSTYCYDQADRLIGSSDVRLASPVYDSRGNTIEIGSENNKTSFVYDSSDRNVSIKEELEEVTNEVIYKRDVTNRIIEHTTKTDGVLKEKVSYAFTGASDSPDVLLDDNGNVKEKYVQLAGDVVLTIRPADNTAAGKTYSIPNIHGDVSATVDGAGTLTSYHMTGPFGEPLPGNTHPNNTAQDTSWGYVGQHEKLTETSVALTPIQMGARVYIPTLGRFITMDPIKGGTENDYTYPQDPINQFDLTGNCFWDACILEVTAVVTVVVGVTAIVASEKYIADKKKSSAESQDLPLIGQFILDPYAGVRDELSSWSFSSEHKKNKRKSNQEKHQKGQERKIKDQKRSEEYKSKTKAQKRKPNRKRWGRS